MTTEVTEFQKISANDPKCDGMNQETIDMLELAWNNFIAGTEIRSLAGLETFEEIGSKSLNSSYVSSSLVYAIGYFADDSIPESVSAAAIDTLLKFGSKGIDLVCSHCRSRAVAQDEKLIILSRLFDGLQRVEGVTLSKRSLERLHRLCSFVKERHTKAWSELYGLSEHKTKKLVLKLDEFDTFIKAL